MKDSGGVMEMAAAVSYAGLAAAYQAPMRRYICQGVLPEGPLRALLEGDLATAIQLAERRGQRISAMMQVWRWVQQHLPAAAHGNRDQVQLWVVYVRRERGRALLALFDMKGENDGSAAAEAAP